jgi:hypothetical protein
VAEGARLESVYTGNRIVGSNPTPSASSHRSVPDTWVAVYSRDMGNTFGPKGLAIGDAAAEFIELGAVPLGDGDRADGEIRIHPL